MSSITPLQPGYWRFDGADIDYGFPIVGYIVSSPDGLILIDPPHAPEQKEEILKLGEPYAAVITGKWHVRGVPLWVKEFHIPVAAPPSARDELREAGLYADVALVDGYEEYGWRVLRLSAGVYDEVALWNAAEGILVLGDLIAEDNEGVLGLGPHQFSKVPLEELRPIVERLAKLEPKLILSGHLGPRSDAKEIFATLLANI